MQNENNAGCVTVPKNPERSTEQNLRDASVPAKKSRAIGSLLMQSTEGDAFYFLTTRLRKVSVQTSTRYQVDFY